MLLNIAGHDVSLTDIKADVIAAKEKGLAGQFAFTPETVEALVEKLSSLTKTAPDRAFGFSFDFTQTISVNFTAEEDLELRVITRHAPASQLKLSLIAAVERMCRCSRSLATAVVESQHFMSHYDIPYWMPIASGDGCVDQ
jgi:hypothetical protein